MNNVFPGAVVHPTDHYGYPTAGASRRIRPTILLVEHTTETYGVPMPGPTKSWTFSLERDGTVHQFMDPVVAAPWTNGDIQNPDLTNPYIAALAGSKYNPNEYVFVTIENVNRIADGQRITAAQLAKGHEIAAWAAELYRKHWGLTIPLDRRHIIGHYQINGVTRINCPTVPADRDRVFSGLMGATLPDTAMEEYMPNLKQMVPARMTLRPETSIRLRPDLSAESKPWVVGKTVSVTAIARVTDGEDFGAGPLWYAYVIDSGGLRYFHSQDVVKTELLGVTVEVVKEVPTGITQDDVNKAVADERERIAVARGNAEADAVRNS